MRTSAIAPRMIVLVTVASAASGPSVFSAPEQFDGHQVLQVVIRDAADVATLEALDALDADLDVAWHGVRAGLVEVRVAPDSRKHVEESGLPFVVVIDDLGARLAALRGTVAGGGFYSDFRPLADHVAALGNLALNHAELAELVSLGTSLEGRPLWALRISGPGPADKPAVFYHGAEHAREWISPPTITYLAEYLINNYASDPAVQSLVDNVEWYLMPVMNPDGYEYSWTNYRFWRKNRADNGDGTFGVDLNRNWAYGWGGAGSSGNTNSDIYRGPSAFSEPETQVLRDFFLAHPQIKVHLDVHSYGNYCLWPFGYTSALSDGETVFGMLGASVRDLVAAVYGNVYTIGSAANALYTASGISLDWVYADRGVWSMTFELRGGGFAPPPSDIILACEENLPAFLDLARWAWDCNDNGLADSQELIATPSLDCDGNGTIDSCEGVPPCAQAPMAAAMGARYLSVSPSPGTVPVALIVTSPAYPCMSQYVSVDGTLSNVPTYRLPAQWGEVSVRGDGILPQTPYAVETDTGLVRSPAASATTWMFGDVNHNGVANFEDILFTVFGFQGQFAMAPLEAMDSFPCTPDGTINFSDIQDAVLAFQAVAMPADACAAPCD